ncbi:MAG TPA: dinitrogenase iron-molybdenum cofactor biosynthesis protein [Thermoplasmatales archaeon]|nr:dinitrogenase iron-molybdenum cofactor biosynthesis protein [Thermoplasmatales archaeon]
MKICIPTAGSGGLGDMVGEHFGRVPTYTIVDLETGDVKIIRNTSIHMGGTLYPPEIMAKEGVDVMICRGLGRRAIGMFRDFNIDVYIGAEGTVERAIELFKQGKLRKAEVLDGCEGQGHRH